MSEQHEHHHHVVPISTLIKNFFFLLVMMVATIAAAQFHIGGSWYEGDLFNNVLALLIASMKALAVVMIFMGVFWGTRLIKLWAATGFVWLLLLMIVFGDYFTREWESVPGWDPLPPQLGSDNPGGSQMVPHDAPGH